MNMGDGEVRGEGEGIFNEAVRSIVGTRMLPIICPRNFKSSRWVQHL